LTPLAAVATTVLLATAPLAAQAPTPKPQQTPSQPAVVSLIGCVERVAAASPARGATPPAAQGPAYKLIDVQPGAGSTTTPKADSQFLLTVSSTLTPPIDLGKFQNQWVEVTGTLSPVPPAKVNPQAPSRPAGETAAAPLPTFTATSVKVVSTECK
jgi:hypothetical protein